MWICEFWSILITFFNNDVIISSLVTNLSSSTAQDDSRHDTTQLHFAVGKFVQTRRDCRQLVANPVHTADATVESRRRCVLSFCQFDYWKPIFRKVVYNSYPFWVFNGCLHLSQIYCECSSDEISRIGHCLVRIWTKVCEWVFFSWLRVYNTVCSHCSWNVAELVRQLEEDTTC